MKKLTIAAAVAGILGSAPTMAYQTGVFANGLLVPDASHAGSAAQTTAVGLTSYCAGDVYWTFFDENSNHVTDGSFHMTANDQAPFIWADESGGGLDNAHGYLVFTMDTAGTASTTPDGHLTTDDVPCLAGNAFYVDTTTNDVAFINTAPLWMREPNSPAASGTAGVTELGEDYGDAGVPDLTALGPGSIVGLYAGAQSGFTGVNGTTAAAALPGASRESLYMRYFIDQATGGNDTEIVVWSSGDVTNNSSNAASFTVNIYDDAENRKSVNFTLSNNELNRIDPETIVGVPAGYTDGFITWPVPVNAGAVFSYSKISAPAFGAVQTVLNPHYATNN